MELARHLRLRWHVCLHRRTVVLSPHKHRPPHDGVPFPRFDSAAELLIAPRASNFLQTILTSRIWSDTVNDASSPPSLLPTLGASSDDLKSEHAKVFVVGARLKKDAGSGVETRKCREAVGRRRRRADGLPACPWCVRE